MGAKTDRRARPAILAALVSAGLLVAGTLVLCPGVVSAAPAGASAAAAGCSATRLAAARAAAETALAGRATRLADLLRAVAGASALTATDRSALTTDLDNELSEVQGLQEKVLGETTCAEVAADARAMVVVYRVYVVVTPQVHLTIAADTESAIVNRLEGLEPAITARITAARQKGETVSSAQATFSDFESQVASAAQSSAGVKAEVLAVTPASYPGCRQTFENARSALASGRTALKQAHADLHTLIDDAK